jgi:ABC-type branched-subunit amino acid transport system substrate-binding protein
MDLKKLLFLAALACCRSAAAEPKLAVLGLAEEKSLESVAVQLAVDASNSITAQAGLRLKPWFVAMSGSPEANLALAQKVAADPDVLGVVLHGEAAADAAVVGVLRQAGLATVSASSWAQPRAKEAFVTWLCPGSEDLAEAAALYARHEARQSQVAVLDNGAPTAVAAARVFANKFRAMGGKVVYEGEWQGTDWGLTRTTRALKANWPQMLFFAGEAGEAGHLVVAMKEEKELKATDLLGQPTVFEPDFFNTARVKSVRTRGFFPCPDFVGTQPLVRLIGIAFPRTSPEYRAYVQVAYKKPGRWAAMLYDATVLVARAVRDGRRPAPAATSVAAAGLSPSAQAASPTAAALLTPTAEAEAAPAALPSRDAVREALLRIDGYRGIRGVVRFSGGREPAEAKAMVYYALNKVNKKEMQWREKNYGPPF